MRRQFLIVFGIAVACSMTGGESLGVDPTSNATTRPTMPSGSSRPATQIFVAIQPATDGTDELLFVENPPHPILSHTAGSADGIKYLDLIDLKSVIFVVEVSPRTVTFLQAIQRELYRSLDMLRPVNSFNIIIADDKPTCFQDGLSLGLPRNRSAGIEFVSKLAPLVEVAPLFPAFYEAVKQQTRRLTLILGGVPSDLTRVQLFISKDDHASRLPIDVIIVGDIPQADTERLAAWSKSTGGLVKTVKHFPPPPTE